MERDDRKTFRLSFHLEQMKSLNLLSRLIPYLSVFFISENYPLPSTLADQFSLALQEPFPVSSDSLIGNREPWRIGLSGLDAAWESLGLVILTCGIVNPSNFPKQSEYIETKKLKEKMKSKRKSHKKNAKGNPTITSMPCVDSVISLPEVLGKLPQPLPWEIVTADMSRCGNEGALGFVGVAGGK